MHTLFRLKLIAWRARRIDRARAKGIVEHRVCKMKYRCAIRTQVHTAAGGFDASRSLASTPCARGRRGAAPRGRVARAAEREKSRSHRARGRDTVSLLRLLVVHLHVLH